MKALSQLLGKLADKALAALPGIIGSILSWILNRAKEVIGWLSQNLWALITGVGVLFFIGLNFRFSSCHFNILFVFFIRLDVRFSFYFLFLLGLDIWFILFTIKIDL